jgi:hypothetical protein
MHARHALLLLAATSALSGCGRETHVRDRDVRGLVEAIQAANARPGADVIVLEKGGLYALRDAPRDATSMLPPIRDDLRIEGNGAEIRRDADGRRALLEVAPGADVRLNALALSEGSDGAIRNFGTLHLDRVKVTDSFGADTPAIVLNHGTLEARDSEIAWNLLAMPRRDAGTVVNYGQLTLRNTSIHDNTTEPRDADLAVAGAVLNLGTVRAESARIEGNVSLDGESAGMPALAFPAVLNLGNGTAEGLPSEQVLEAGMLALAQR